MTPIEAKRELVKVALPMIGFDGTLMCPQKPSFESSRYSVDAWHGNVSRIIAR